MDPNRTQLGTAPTTDIYRTMMGAAPTIRPATLNATQTIQPVQCPVCKTFNPVGVMFCVDCGLIFDRSLPGDAFGAPAVQMPVLLDSSGREHVLRPGENVLGRQGDLIFDDSRVSRRHAAITLSGPDALVADLGSTNGTKVNGERISDPTALPPGAVLSLGGVELTFCLPGQANRTEMPAGGRTQAVSAPTLRPAATLVSGDQKWPLKAGENSFGRRDGNDIVVPDPYISSRHAVIEVADDGVYLTDLGSTNGTRIEGSPVAPEVRTRWEPGAVMQIGHLQFTLERS